MTEEGAKLILELLREIGTDVAAIKEDVREMRARLTRTASLYARASNAVQRPRGEPPKG